METNDDNKPTINKNRIKIPDALGGLIEKPPLLEGEDPEQFWNFFGAVVDEEKPRGILGWVSAMDIAIKSWEELRLKRSSVALINGGMLEALIYFLDTMKPTALGGDLKNATKSSKDVALKYFSSNPKERNEVVARLAQHGITLAELQAKAAELNGEPLQMFERMIATRENGRRQLRKEAAQHQAKRDKGEPNLSLGE